MFVFIYKGQPLPEIDHTQPKKQVLSSIEDKTKVYAPEAWAAVYSLWSNEDYYHKDELEEVLLMDLEMLREYGAVFDLNEALRLALEIVKQEKAWATTVKINEYLAG